MADDDQLDDVVSGPMAQWREMLETQMRAATSWWTGTDPALPGAMDSARGPERASALKAEMASAFRALTGLDPGQLAPPADGLWSPLQAARQSLGLGDGDAMAITAELAQFGASTAASTRATLALIQVMTEAWMTAAGAFAEKRIGQSSADADTDLVALQREWVATVEPILQSALGSDAFAQAQAEFIRTASRSAKARSALARRLASALEVPHRQEMNETYAAIQDMRREIRSLRRNQARLEAALRSGTAAREPNRESGMATKPFSNPAAAAEQMGQLWVRLNAARGAVAGVDADDVEIALTPKDEIARDGNVRLYRYRPLVENPLPVPVLYAFALVGRFTIADLTPDRSLIRRLLEQGLDIYAIDWGHPRAVDCHIGLEDYIAGYIDEFVDIVRERANVEKINLLGICQGGIFHTIYASMFPEKVNAVVTTVAPFDFHANVGDEQVGRGLIHTWARALDAADVDLAVDASGNLSGDLMAKSFGFMTPASTLTKYSLDLLEIAEDEPALKSFLSMERWLSDRPDHTAASLRQWIKDFYVENRLAKGELTIGRHRVDLSNVQCPVLNIYGEHDVIAPPACSTALAGLVGTRDYTELPFPGGHVGIFVGKRAQATLAPAIAAWLRERSPIE